MQGMFNNFSFGFEDIYVSQILCKLNYGFI